MKIQPITSFSEENHFLSNFFMAKFTWRNREFASGEHAFQAAKHLVMSDCYIDDMDAYIKSVQAAPTPKKAKYLGRSVKIDKEDWEKQKVYLMREIIHSKFKNNESEFDLIGSLINTGAAMLVEGNDWGDKIWGRTKENGKWVGLNLLGVILMEERGYWLRGI